jgi:hypothetical protein
MLTPKLEPGARARAFVSGGAPDLISTVGEGVLV